MKKILVKISKFPQITGIINITVKPSQVQKHTRPKIYNTWALPTLMYRCESEAIREQDNSRMSAEMKFMRGMAKYIQQDYKTNADILSELEINSVVKKIQNYRNKWIQHVWQMDGDRLTYLLTYSMEQSPS